MSKTVFDISSLHDKYNKHTDDKCSVDDNHFDKNGDSHFDKNGDSHFDKNGDSHFDKNDDECDEEVIQYSEHYNVIIPIFKERREKKRNCDDSVHIRQNVNKRIWYAFKTVVSLNGWNQSDQLNGAISLWIDSVSNIKFKCVVCENVIDESSCLLYSTKGCDHYFCSMKCFDEYRVDDEGNVSDV